jgi:hypothetical protein
MALDMKLRSDHGDVGRVDVPLCCQGLSYSTRAKCVRHSCSRQGLGCLGETIIQVVR